MDKLSLKNLGNGAAIEKFDHELAKVIGNIIDPNTDPKATREIILKVKLTPDDYRANCVTSVEASCKLAKDIPYLTAIGVGVDPGGVVRAQEYYQEPLFPQGDQAENVTKFPKQEVGK